MAEKGQTDARALPNRNGFDWSGSVIHAIAISVEVFLHRRFGERYLGTQAAAVMVLVPLYAAFWPNHDCRPLLLFLAAYLVMCVFARIGVLIRRRRGEHTHSQYTGTPQLLRIFPRFDELIVKQYIEPMLILFSGAFMCGVNEPLAVYLLIAGICLGAMVNLSVARDERLALDMHDAVIEQQERAEQFRRLRGDR